MRCGSVGCFRMRPRGAGRGDSPCFIRSRATWPSMCFFNTLQSLGQLFAATLAPVLGVLGLSHRIRTHQQLRRLPLQRRLPAGFRSELDSARFPACADSLIRMNGRYR